MTDATSDRTEEERIPLSRESIAADIAKLNLPNASIRIGMAVGITLERLENLKSNKQLSNREKQLALLSIRTRFGRDLRAAGLSDLGVIKQLNKSIENLAEKGG